MGFIKSFVDSAKGTLADQWKDYLVPMEGVPATAGIFPAVLRSTNAGRGSNTKGSENIISNGSKIIVPEGMALITMQDGAITGCITEPGGFIYTTDDVNAKSIFAGDGMISSLVKQSWDRFKFGGQPGSMQTAVYVNLKEIPNNKFGTTGIKYWYDSELDTQMGARIRGVYTLKIVDPILFIKNFVPLKYIMNGEIFDFADIDNNVCEELFGEIVESLSDALGKYINDDTKEHSIRTIQKDQMGFTKTLAQTVEETYKWKSERGIEIIRVVMEPIEYDEESQAIFNQAREDDRELRRDRKRAQTLSGDLGNAFMQQAVARGMQAAGENGGGAGLAFMGMGLNAAGNMMGAVQQTNAIQEDPYEKLAKFKKMLDDGLITQEEYDEQKKKILGV